MLQPRRRSIGLLPLLFLLAVVLLSTTASAATAVLGIDLGTEYIKVGHIKHGSGKDVVLTKDSRRKEASTLAFKPSKSGHGDFPERLYGADAVALSARFPGDVYPNLKTLLGIKFGSDAQSTYSKNYPGLRLEAMDRDGSGLSTVGIRSETLGEKEQPFSIEELLAMELKNVLANAKAAVPKGMTAKDAVITYPAFYTADEKRAVELAAELAGVRVLGLLTDGAAVAVDYGSSRAFPGLGESVGKHETHVIYDMGAGSTTATVVKFSEKEVKDIGKFNKTVQEILVIGTAWDRTLGGDAFNQVIVEDMISKLVGSKGMQALDVQTSQIRHHAKTMAKIWKEAERMRHMLSANTETSASFEGLYHEDVTFKYKITRADFEKLTTEFADRTRSPLIQALEAAHLSVEDVESVILHGGATRTPFVQKQLEAAVGTADKVRTNVNADESACLGASMKAAMISPAFKITKELRVYDSPGYAVGIKWTDGKERSQRIFTTSSKIGSEKVLPFKNQEDFTLQFYQSRDGAEVPITQVDMLNLTASVAQLKDKGCGAANISTKFTALLSNFDGLPQILNGSVSCEVEPAKEGSLVDGVKGLFGFGSGSKKDGDQEPLKPKESDSTSSTTSTESSTIELDESSTSSLFSDESASPSRSTASTTSASSSSKTSGKSSAKTPAPTGPYTVTIPIAVTAKNLGLGALPNEASMRSIKARLKAFDGSDRARLDRAEALNNLEAYTYRARDHLQDDDFLEHTTEEAQTILAEKLSAASDWLYEDGLNANTAEYKAKLDGLKNLTEPVLFRIKEGKDRPQAMDRLRGVLKKMDETIAKIIRDVVEGIKRQQQEDFDHESLLRVLETSTIDWFASSSSTEEASTSTSTPDDLDGDPYSSASTATSSTAAAAATDEVDMPYSKDLEDLKRIRNETQAWYQEHLKMQKDLKPTDEPTFLSKDVWVYAQQVSDEVRKIETRIEKAEKRRKAKEAAKKKEPSSSKSRKASKNGSSTSSTSATGKKATDTSSKTTTSSSNGASESTSSSRKDEL
ncbi:MAG: hypothetical protein Q9227_000278 [Pyrenula ochraceoflavens]